jgi:starvation-inducible DNA-binding protein
MSQATTEKTKVDAGLSAEGVDAIAAQLNQYLADLHVLYTKLHNFHWNVEGPSFYTLHEKIEELYEATADEIDDVAERVLKVGRRPLARLADYVNTAKLPEMESRKYTGTEIADALIADYKSLIAELRETVSVAQEHGDEGTADDAVGMLKDKEKQLWMLTAYRG